MFEDGKTSMKSLGIASAIVTFRHGAGSTAKRER
jgi:hypothetical protein